MGHLVSVVTIMRLSKHDFRAEFDRLHPHTESLLRSSMDFSEDDRILGSDYEKPAN